MVEYQAQVLGKELQIKYFTDDNEAVQAIRLLHNERLLGFDTETTALSPLESPNARWRLVQLATLEGKVFVLDMWKLGVSTKEALAELLSSSSIKVGHNLKFDIKFARHELPTLIKFGGLFDSMLAEQVLAFGDIRRKVGLDSCLVRYFDESISKDEQTSDWGSNELSSSQIIYAAIDAYVPLRLREVMLPIIIDNGLVETCKLEFGVVDAIALMELNGFYLNVDRWQEQIESSLANQQKAVDELMTLAAPAFPQETLFDGAPLFNPRSPKQLIECLTKLNIPLPEKDGKVTTSGWRLKFLVNDYPIIAALLDFREWSKRTSSYGESYLKHVNPYTNRIHADARIIGAMTGRMSFGNPNLQQLPGSEMFRRCFTPQSSDKKLVVSDYAAIELRILADYSQESNFVNAFLNGEDLHTLTGCRLFNTTPDKLTKLQRHFAKTINFGIAYGMGGQTLSIRTGETIEYSENALADYRRQNGVLCSWLDEIADDTVRSRQVRTYSGRLVKFKFDPRDRRAVGDVMRNGKNTPPQGGCADILKLALAVLHDKLLTNPQYFNTSLEPRAKLVNVVHDEIVLETDADFAEEAGQILSQCMVEAGQHFVKTIPIEADYEVLDEWVKS